MNKKVHIAKIKKPEIAIRQQTTEGLKSEIYNNIIAGTRGIVVFIDHPKKRYLRRSLLGENSWDRTLYDNIFLRPLINELNTYTYHLPCRDFEFNNNSSEIYTPINDAIPRVMRVKMSPSGKMSLRMSFPLIIANATPYRYIESTYKVLEQFIKEEGRILYFASSMCVYHTKIDKLVFFPCFLERFSVSVSGERGLEPVYCNVSLGSIHSDVNYMVPSSTVLGPSLDNFMSPSEIIPYGGRMVTIKDCSLTYGDLASKRIIRMSLNVSQNFNVVNTSNYYKDIRVSVPYTHNHVFLNSRTVDGSISFIADDIAYRKIIEYQDNQDRAKRGLYNREFGDYYLPIPLEIDLSIFKFTMPAIYITNASLSFSPDNIPVFNISFFVRSNDINVPAISKSEFE